MEDNNISSNTNGCHVDITQEFEVCVEDKRNAETLKCSQLQLELKKQREKTYRQVRELLTKDKVIMALGEKIDSLESEIRYSKEVK